MLRSSESDTHSSPASDRFRYEIVDLVVDVFAKEDSRRIWCGKLVKRANDKIHAAFSND